MPITRYNVFLNAISLAEDLTSQLHRVTYSVDVDFITIKLNDLLAEKLREEMLHADH